MTERASSAILWLLRLNGYRVTVNATPDGCEMRTDGAEGVRVVRVAGDDAEYRCACELARAVGIRLEG